MGMSYPQEAGIPSYSSKHWWDLETSCDDQMDYLGYSDGPFASLVKPSISSSRNKDEL